jgi:hypothetical protein
MEDEIEETKLIVTNVFYNKYGFPQHPIFVGCENAAPCPVIPIIGLGELM